MCVCMKPARRDECSGAPHWPVGCDGLTSLSMRVLCEMSKRLACLRGRLMARERAMGCSLGGYTLIAPV